MTDITLDNISINDKCVTYRFSVSDKLSKYFNTHQLVIEYDEDASMLPESILTIPFAGIFSTFSWITDSVLWVKDIDNTFYDAFKFIKLGFKELYPHFHFGGRFVAARRTQNSLHATDPDSALLLFSGGIDAHSSYINNASKQLRLINIQGRYTDINDHNKAAEADFRDISAFASAQHRSTTFVKSNFARIVNSRFDKDYRKQTKDSWWHGFLHSTAFISMAIPIAYKHNIAEIIIASSFTIGDKRVCASYPTTDAEFKFATSGFVSHDGFELDRQQKVGIIVAHQKASGKPYPVRVCSFNDHNCCICEKCFRTILGIVAEGGDIKDFGFLIDKPLRDFFDDYMRHNLSQFGVRNEALTHWPHIRARMMANYDNIKEKDFADWFLSFDFIKERRYALAKYYLTNFPSIIRRKLHL